LNLWIVVWELNLVQIGPFFKQPLENSWKIFPKTRIYIWRAMNYQIAKMIPNNLIIHQENQISINLKSIYIVENLLWVATTFQLKFLKLEVKWKSYELESDVIHNLTMLKLEIVKVLGISVISNVAFVGSCITQHKEDNDLTPLKFKLWQILWVQISL
jgi:hypothetical protein